MIVLRWRTIRPLTLRWIGQADMLPPLVTPGAGHVAAIVGPPGSPGRDGAAQIPEILDGGHF